MTPKATVRALDRLYDRRGRAVDDLLRRAEALRQLAVDFHAVGGEVDARRLRAAAAFVDQAFEAVRS